jgi:hypothetical protein
MEGYLFPVSHPSSSTPFKLFMKEFIPAARKSLLIIDPHPHSAVIKQLIRSADPRVNCRILLQFNPRSRTQDLHNATTFKGLMKGIRSRGIQVRCVPDLSARLYIADDTAMIISGQYTSNTQYGIVLPGFDSQPVIEHWESIWKSARKYSPDSIQKIQMEFLKHAQQGDIAPEEFVHLMNQQGYFIDVHIHFFRGYQRLTLKMDSDMPSDTQKPQGIIWSMIASHHYHAFSREAGRLRAMKSKAYLLKTPLGPFLLKKDFKRWMADFEERTDALRLAISKYLSTHYKQMKEEAIKTLETRLEAHLSTMSKGSRLIPVPKSESFVKDHLKKFSSRFPNRRQLLDSCSCVFSRFGLHPDMIHDHDLMDILNQISFQQELI